MRYCLVPLSGVQCLRAELGLSPLHASHGHNCPSQTSLPLACSVTSAHCAGAQASAHLRCFPWALQQSQRKD